MPASSEAGGGNGPPTVSLSFSNMFWGLPADIGVEPLLSRMQNAKTTCDELKSFYKARADLEEEYAKKLQKLAKEPYAKEEEIGRAHV